MPKKVEITPARAALIFAHRSSAEAGGRLALVIESGRGLNRRMILEVAAAFERAATALREMRAPENADA